MNDETMRRLLRVLNAGKELTEQIEDDREVLRRSDDGDRGHAQRDIRLTNWAVAVAALKDKVKV